MCRENSTVPILEHSIPDYLTVSLILILLKIITYYFSIVVFSLLSCYAKCFVVHLPVAHNVQPLAKLIFYLFNRQGGKFSEMLLYHRHPVQTIAM